MCLTDVAEEMCPKMVQEFEKISLSRWTIVRRIDELFFISIFILLNRRKATEALIHRIGNYPDLLRRCKILLSASNLIEILLSFKTACQDHQAGECAVKCLSQKHNRMARVGFEPNRVADHPGSLTTRPRCRHCFRTCW